MKRIVMWLHVVALAIFLSTPVLASPEEVRVGQQYNGGTRVQFSSLGVSFVIPSAWIGALPEGAAFFVMGSQTKPGMILAWAEPSSSLAALKVMLSSPVPLDGRGAILQPTGPAQVTGNVVTASFTTSVEGQTFIGLAKATVNPHSTAVGFIALGPVDQKGQFSGLVNGLLGSLQTMSKQQMAQSSGSWNAKLRGWALLYMKTTSGGLSTKKKISLCPDGTFNYSDNDTYLSGGTSGVGHTSESGTWKIHGSTLLLTNREGSTGAYNLEHHGGKIFVDGQHWFRTDEVNCSR